MTPEVAFTGDTAAEVFNSPGFEDALAAKLLIIEATFLEDDISPEHAKVTMAQSWRTAITSIIFLIKVCCFSLCGVCKCGNDM